MKKFLMKYLLDTHVILWWLTDPKKIKNKAHKIISDKLNTIFISSASFWEMAIKKRLGRITLPYNLIETLNSEGFEILPIMPSEALGVADLPLLHNDPFDRILIMQAKLYDLIMITSDPIVIQYPIITLDA